MFAQNQDSPAQAISATAPTHFTPVYPIAPESPPESPARPPKPTVLGQIASGAFVAFLGGLCTYWMLGVMYPIDSVNQLRGDLIKSREFASQQAQTVTAAREALGCK
jgi:hypothetical protein